MVGMVGFAPTVSCSQSTRNSYYPTLRVVDEVGYAPTNYPCKGYSLLLAYSSVVDLVEIERLALPSWLCESHALLLSETSMF